MAEELETAAAFLWGVPLDEHCTAIISIASVGIVGLLVAVRLGYRLHVRRRARGLYISSLERDRVDMLAMLAELHGDATAQLDALERRIAAMGNDADSD